VLSSFLFSSKLFRISTALSLAVWISAVFVKEYLGLPIAVFMEKCLRIRVEAKIPLHKPKVFAERPV